MRTYLFRRTFAAAPLIWLISLLIFLAIELSPGDPVLRISRRPGALTSDQLLSLREEYGLDEPVIPRYGKWIVHILQGDFGYSYTTRRPVLEEIRAYLGNTIILMGITLIVVVVIAIPLGMLSAVKPYSTVDMALTTLAFIGQSIPAYWLGTMLLFIFHDLLINPFTSRPLLPIGGISSWGSTSNFLDRLQHLVLPVTALAVGWVSVYMRFLRSSLLDVLQQDYIVAAAARGLSQKRILLKHAFKNAASPIVTLLALDLPIIVAGALYIEVIFSWPGIGRLFYQAAKSRDYPVLLALAMMIAVAVVVCNLLADIAYALLDPRVRFDESRDILA